MIRNLKKDQFQVLRKIDKKNFKNQRELASSLGYSLGKINYCLKELKKKGFIKINNFKNNPNKAGYIYLLTPKGIKAKAELTLNFMKRKMEEYDELVKEYKQLIKDKNVDSN